MKSMLIAAISVGLVAASVLLYLKKGKPLTKENKSLQTPAEGPSIRMGQHAMG